MRQTDVGSDAHLILDLYEHLQQIGLIPLQAAQRELDKPPIREEIRILIDRAKETGVMLGHAIEVQGGDPIPVGGPSAAHWGKWHPRGTPWAPPPTDTPVMIRGYKFLDSSAHKQLLTLRDRAIADLQVILKDEFYEDETRRIL